MLKCFYSNAQKDSGKSSATCNTDFIQQNFKEATENNIYHGPGRGPVSHILGELTATVR